MRTFAQFFINLLENLSSVVTKGLHFRYKFPVIPLSCKCLIFGSLFSTHFKSILLLKHTLLDIHHTSFILTLLLSHISPNIFKPALHDTRYLFSASSRHSQMCRTHLLINANFPPKRRFLA